MQQYDRISDEAHRGCPVIERYVANLNLTNFEDLWVLVTMYRGNAKIHVGTSDYVHSMEHKSVSKKRPQLNGTNMQRLKPRGITVPYSLLMDITKRIGPCVLEEFTTL
jgi:hypothetical protein